MIKPYVKLRVSTEGKNGDEYALGFVVPYMENTSIVDDEALIRRAMATVRTVMRAAQEK